MKTLFITSLIVSLVFSIVALGQITPSGPSDEYEQEQFDNLAYKKTLELCTQINKMNSLDDQVNVSWEFLKYAVDGTLSGLQLWKDDALSISNTTRLLVKSRGYQTAIAQCYPNNTVDQKLFTGLIIGEDAGGHILGFIAWMIPISKLSKMFLATKWAARNPALIKGGATIMSFVKYTTLAALAGITAYDGYEQYDLYKNGARYLSEYDEEMVRLANQVSDENLKLVLNKLALIDEQLKTEKDPTKIRNLLYQKGLLEERVRDHNTPLPADIEPDVSPK